MRQIPEYALWIGHAGDVRNLPAIHEAGIVAVVDLAVQEPPGPIARDLLIARFPIVDGPGNPPWMLRAAVDLAAGLVADRVPTLIGCGAGMSRSPCIAAAAIARVLGIPADEGLALVLRSAPADVAPGLWAEIRSLVG